MENEKCGVKAENKRKNEIITITITMIKEIMMIIMKIKIK